MVYNDRICINIYKEIICLASNIQLHVIRGLYCVYIMFLQVGEVGELSEIFQWKGEVARGLPNWTSDDKEHLEEELSDVLLYLVRLADVCGLDLGQAALTKIVKNARKYPVNK